MKLYYYPETDSLYVEFQSRPAVDTREITEDVRLDLDEQGRPVGLDIDHASAVLELERLETAGLPFKATAMSAQAEAPAAGAESGPSSGLGGSGRSGA